MDVSMRQKPMQHELSASAGARVRPLDPINTELPWERTKERANDPHLISRFGPERKYGFFVVWEDGSDGSSRLAGSMDTRNVDGVRADLTFSLDPQLHSSLKMRFVFPITQRANETPRDRSQLPISFIFRLRDTNEFGIHFGVKELPASLAALADTEITRKAENGHLMMLDVSLQRLMVVSHLHDDVDFYQHHQTHLEQLRSLSRAPRIKIFTHKWNFLDAATIEGKQISTTLAAERQSRWHFLKLLTVNTREEDRTGEVYDEDSISFEIGQEPDYFGGDILKCRIPAQNVFMNRAHFYATFVEASRQEMKYVRQLSDVVQQDREAQWILCPWVGPLKAGTASEEELTTATGCQLVPKVKRRWLMIGRFSEGDMAREALKRGDYVEVYLLRPEGSRSRKVMSGLVNDPPLGMRSKCDVFLEAVEAGLDDTIRDALDKLSSRMFSESLYTKDSFSIKLQDPAEPFTLRLRGLQFLLEGSQKSRAEGKTSTATDVETECMGHSLPALQEPINIFEGQAEDFDKEKWYASKQPRPSPSQIGAINALERLNRRIFILNGPAGTGKSYWVALVAARLAAANQPVLIAAGSNTATNVATVKCGLQLGLDNVVRIESLTKPNITLKIAAAIARMEWRAQNPNSDESTVVDSDSDAPEDYAPIIEGQEEYSGRVNSTPYPLDETDDFSISDEWEKSRGNFDTFGRALITRACIDVDVPEAELAEPEESGTYTAFIQQKYIQFIRSRQGKQVHPPNDEGAKSTIASAVGVLVKNGLGLPEATVIPEDDGVDFAKLEQSLLRSLEARFEQTRKRRVRISQDVEPYTESETMVRRAQLGSKDAAPDKWSRLRELYQVEITTGLESMAKAEYLDAMEELRQECLRSAKVIVGTLTGCASNDTIRERGPSVVIIDEAGQASPSDVLMTMGNFCSSAKAFILVGDPNQFSPTVLSANLMSKTFGEIDEPKDDDGRKTRFKSLRHTVDTSKDRNPFSAQLRKSELIRFLENGAANWMLTEQFRMVPQIAAISNKHIYNGQVSDDASTFVENRAEARPIQDWFEKEFSIKKQSLVAVDIANSEAFIEEGGTSRSNPIFAEYGVRKLSSLVKSGVVNPKDIAVICTYAAQSNLWALKLMEIALAPGGDKRLQHIKVWNIDATVGKEASFVIVDTVVAFQGGLPAKEQDSNFMKNRNRLNVAMTRARNGCIFIGDQQLANRRNPPSASDFHARIWGDAATEGWLIKCNVRNGKAYEMGV